MKLTHLQKAIQEKWIPALQKEWIALTQREFLYKYETSWITAHKLFWAQWRKKEYKHHHILTEWLNTHKWEYPVYEPKWEWEIRERTYLPWITLI